MPNVRIGPTHEGRAQGRMFWSPAEEGSCVRKMKTVRRKGIVEGPNGHPVVAISRRAEENNLVYPNPDTSSTRSFRLAQRLTIPISAKGQNLDEPKRITGDLSLERIITSTQAARSDDVGRDAAPKRASKKSYEHSRVLQSPQPDLEVAGVRECTSRPEISSPDTTADTTARNSFIGDVWLSFDHMIKHVAAVFEGKTTPRKTVVRRPLSRFWVDAKGVMAVAIASM